MRVKQQLLCVAVCAAMIIPQVLGLSKLTIPFYAKRSQGAYVYREVLGIADMFTACCTDNLLITVANVEYYHTFNSTDLSDCFWGRDYVCARSMPGLTIAGSQVDTRSDTYDWLADYFGLSPSSVSNATMTPVCKGVICDWFTYVGLNQWCPGLFCMFEVPWAYDQRKILFCEQKINMGENGYYAGYFAPTAVPREQLVNSAKDFFVNQAAPILGDGIQFEPLSAARISTEFRNEHSVAELNCALGYNILLDPDYHLGIMLRIRIPTGTRPVGIFLFEPVVGNGHHAAVGAGLTGHAKVWTNQACDKHLGLFVQAAFVDLLETQQRRSFDLRDQNNSRYMLAARVAQPNTDLLYAEDGGRVFPLGQFKAQYAPVANLTTLDVRVKGGFESEVFFMAHFAAHHWNIDLGYDYFYRTCETLRPLECPTLNRLETKEWVLKGDAQMYGFVCESGEPIPLSASQSMATIHVGANIQRTCPDDEDTCTAIAPNDNPGIDNPQPAFVPDDQELVISPDNLECDEDNQINTSIQPRFLQTSSLDFCGAASSSTLHSLVVQVTWHGEQCLPLTPLLGLGARITGSGKDDDPFKRPNYTRCVNPCSQSQCASCVDCTGQCLDCGHFEWSLWIRGGLRF